VPGIATGSYFFQRTTETVSTTARALIDERTLEPPEQLGL
jgi:hypothetical protein